MFTPYHITIRNQTGKTQNYTCLTAGPKLAGAAADATAFKNVLFPSCVTPPGTKVHFNVTHQHYLVWDVIQGSTKSAAADGDNGQEQLSQSRAVKLGGGIAANTYYVVDEDEPEQVYLPDQVAAGVGERAVVADTGDLKFSPGNDTIVVAIRAAKGRHDYQAIGTFTPSPDVRYFVPSPPEILVVCGESMMMAGQLVNVKDIAKSISVDFATRSGQTADLVDGKDGWMFV